MNIRPIEDKDYPEVLSWFATQTWNLPPVDSAMPRHCLIAEDEQGVVAAGWLYATESSVGFLEWMATNPKRAIEYKNAALKAIIKKFVDMGSVVEPSIALFTVYTKNPELMGLLKDIGFWIKPQFYQATFIVGKSGIPDRETEEL